MLMKWKIFLPKIIIWLTAEIFLSFLGLDSLADYSEFLFERHVSLLTPNHQILIVGR